MLGRILRVLWPRRFRHEVEAWVPGVRESRAMAQRESRETRKDLRQLRRERLNPIAESAYPTRHKGAKS
jgi:hypothetical protein